MHTETTPHPSDRRTTLPEPREWATHENDPARARADADALAERHDGAIGDSPAALRADIRATRARMSDTLDEIADRLNVNRVKQEVASHVKQSVRDAKQSVRDATIGRIEHMTNHASDRAHHAQRSFTATLKDNPIPAAMVGIGLGWLLMNRRSAPEDREWALQRERPSRDFDAPRAAGGAAASESRGFAPGSRDRYRDYRSASNLYEERELMLEPAREPNGANTTDHYWREAGTERSRTDQARDRGHELADQARENADRFKERSSELASNARDRAQRGRERIEETYDDNPFALGVAALAVGLVAGLAVPSTRKESELMGDARDRIVDRVKEEADDMRQRVENVAREVAQDAKDSAREHASEVKQSAKQHAKEEGLTA